MCYYIMTILFSNVKIIFNVISSFKDMLDIAGVEGRNKMPGNE